LEVEAKFSVPDEETFQRLLAVPALAGFDLGNATVAELYDQYLDTPEGTILAGGFACRIRRQDGRYLATLKGLGDVSGAVHRRLEHEIDLPQPLPPQAWPPGTARDLVLYLAGDAPLAPLFAVEQVRHSRPLFQDGRLLADVNLDRVRLLLDGQAVAAFLELEAELRPLGTGADLERLCRELTQTWDLPPQPRSKFERGLLALEARASHVQLLDKPGIEPDDPMSEAGRKTLRFHFRRMLYYEPGTRLGVDAEALHDMRVATRRMRAALRIFGEYYDPQAVAPCAKDLRRAGRALGAVRDLDVFVEKVVAYRDTLPEAQQNSLEGLLAVLEERREAARQRMIAYLDGKKHRRFVKRLARFVETKGLGSAPPEIEDYDLRPDRVRHVAPLAIYERLASVRAYDKWLSIPSDQPELVEGPPLARFHALRIACKRLRYTLEFFQEVLGPGAKAVVKEVVALQDHLGALQDAAVASEILRDLSTLPGVEDYLAARQSEVQELLATFPEIWSRLTSAEFSQRIAQAVMIL
jgi:CHAD domain-containing protein